MTLIIDSASRFLGGLSPSIDFGSVSVMFKFEPRRGFSLEVIDRTTGTVFMVSPERRRYRGWYSSITANVSESEARRLLVTYLKRFTDGSGVRVDRLVAELHRKNYRDGSKDNEAYTEKGGYVYSRMIVPAIAARVRKPQGFFSRVCSILLNGFRSS